MLGDVEAERLLLHAQQLGLLELGRRRSADGASRLGASVSPKSKIEPWPASRSACCFWPYASACSSTREHPLPRAGQRAALDERLERALVDDRRVDALGEVPDRLERAALLARADDRAARELADALHGVEAEADLAADDGEVDLRLVHVGRQHLDPELVARVDVERHAVLRAHHGADQRGHVLARVVRAQPGGAVRDQRVAGGVRLVERVVLRLLHVVPELARDRVGRVVRDRALDELVLQRRHQRVDLLADRLAQVVGLGGREAADLLGDLHRLLLVDGDAERRAEDRLRAAGRGT